MSMKFTQIPADTFQKLQLNAGILIDTFDPATQQIGNLLGATGGGVTFVAKPEFKDYGEDIDNCPQNMKELKKLTKWLATMVGTFKSVDVNQVKNLVAVADIDSNDATKVIPRSVLLETDFADLWWVGDYSEVNTGNDAGFIAIHMMSALNTAGFSLKSNNESKGEFAFNYEAHYSMDDQTTVPFEIYVKAGA